MVKKVLKFATVGVINTLISLTIFEVIILLINVHRHDDVVIYSIGLFADFCGLVNSFIFNKRWTFKDANKKYFKQFSVFLILSVVSILINNLLVILFNHIFPESFDILGYSLKSILLTKAFAILFTMVLNFVFYKTFIFKDMKILNN